MSLFVDGSVYDSRRIQCSVWFTSSVIVYRYHFSFVVCVPGMACHKVSRRLSNTS